MSNPNGRWEFDKDGNVHYIPPDGAASTDTGSTSQRPQTPPKYTPNHSTKKNDNSWHWLIIVLAFMIAWPVGLILLFLELSGKWPAEKKVEQELDRAVEAAKNAASKAKKSSSTRATTKTASAPPPFTAPSGTKEKAKKTKKQQEKKEARSYGLGNIRLFKILGWCFTGVFGFATIMTLVDDLTYFISLGYLLENLIPLLAFTLIGITLLGVAGSRSRKLKKFRKYLKLVGCKEEVSLSSLAQAMGVSEKKVIADVEEMLDRDVFESGYIDMARKTLVLREGGISEPVAPPQPETPEEELSTADATLRRIRKINDAIENQELSDKIDHIEELTAKIFRLLEDRPEKASELRSFMNYYLPQTLKILENYAKLEAQGIEGDNIAEAKQKIEGMMDKVVDGYESQLDNLFADDVLDISADLKVMETMLEKDGLTLESDFKF